MAIDLRLRRARPDEASRLSDLAFRSKAHWGYSEEFMEACRAEMTVTDESITGTASHYVVAETDEGLKGFYALNRVPGGQSELDALFVAPGSIGQGVGKALFNHARQVATLAGSPSIIIQGDPHAEPFYHAVGAVPAGFRPSGSIPGRDLPLFVIELPPGAPGLQMPDASLEASYAAYIRELGTEERYPFPMDFDHGNFPAMLERIEDFRRGRDLPEGYVSSTTYWYVLEGELLGAANLRHRLNDTLRHCGGHIGLGIRPSYRGLGLGVDLLTRTVEAARAQGVETIHIHCYRGNEASARMITAAGGRLDSEVEEPGSGRPVQRYLI